MNITREWTEINKTWADLKDGKSIEYLLTPGVLFEFNRAFSGEKQKMLVGDLNSFGVEGCVGTLFGDDGFIHDADLILRAKVVHTVDQDDQ